MNFLSILSQPQGVRSAGCCCRRCRPPPLCWLCDNGGGLRQCSLQRIHARLTHSHTLCTCHRQRKRQGTASFYERIIHIIAVFDWTCGLLLEVWPPALFLFRCGRPHFSWWCGRPHFFWRSGRPHFFQICPVSC